MRDTAIGVVLAALFLGALFALNHFYPRTLNANMAQTANEIQHGFSGRTMIGPWQLVCPPAPSGAKAAIPFSLNPNPRTAAATAAQGRCRATLIERRKDNPKAIVLVVNFRLAGQGQNLAMIVLLPPLAKKGDTILMRLGRAGLKLPVDGCNKGECIARGVLGAQAQAVILAAPRAMLVFPPVGGAKPVGLVVPLDGLALAVSAMRRAES